MERLDLASWRLSLSRGLKGVDLPVLTLAVVVVAAPLLLGGVHLATQISLSAIALIGFIALTFRLRARKSKVRLGLIGLSLLIALAVTLLQWLPLPLGLVELIAPESAQSRLALASLMGMDPPSFAPLSLDGSRTAASFVVLVGYMAVFLTAANLNDHLNRLRLVGGFVQWAGLAEAAVGLVQTALGADEIYGVYQASVSLESQFFLTSFVNPNHAAALMLLSASISFGLWASSKDPVATKFHFVATAILIVAVCATGSKACILLVIAALIGAGSWASYRTGDSESKERTKRGALGLLLGLALLVFFVVPPQFFQNLVVEGQWQSAFVDEELVSRWHVGGRVASDYWVLGTGAGAFGTAASQVMESWSGGLVTYAHNFVLQAVSDWGLFVSLLVAILLLVGVIGLVRRAKWRPECVGLAVGVGLLFIQNLVDFSFLIPGVGYAAMASAGFLVGHVIRRSQQLGEPKETWRRPSIPWKHGYSLAFVGLFSLCAIHGWSHSAEHWNDEARMALQEDKPGRLDLEVMLTEHPQDFHLMTVASYIASATDREDLSKKFLDRALVLAPHSIDVLTRRARHELDHTRPKQALPFIEVLASEGDIGMREAVKLVLQYARYKELADAFFGQDEAHVRFGIEQLRQKGLQESVEHLLAWSVTAFPDSTWVREELASIWVYKAGKEDALDSLSLKMLAESVETVSPEKSNQLKRTGYMIQGYLLKRKRRLSEAYHMFSEAAVLEPERSTKPLLESGDILAQMGDLERLDSVLARLDSVMSEAPLVRGPYHVLKSRALEARGKARHAINEMQRAILYLKHQSSYYERLAGLYESIGDAASAQNVRERLAQNVSR